MCSWTDMKCQVNFPIKQKNSSFPKRIKTGRWELNCFPTAKQPLTWEISLFKKGKFGILGFVAFICFVFADQGRENAFDYWTEMALNWLSFTDVGTLTLHLFKRYKTTEPSQSGFHNVLQNICNRLFPSFSIVFWNGSSCLCGLKLASLVRLPASFQDSVTVFVWNLPTQALCTKDKI